jgi:hypothetical protein
LSALSLNASQFCGALELPEIQETGLVRRLRLRKTEAMLALKPGDILSYSSGSHDRGPYGFRTLHRGGNLRALLENKWPNLFDGFGDRLPLVINAYPAAIGTFEFGVSVDSYLSLSTGSRALHLAHLEKMPVLLLGQPLYIADLVCRHLQRSALMPDTLLIATGGYVMPRALEATLRQVCSTHAERLSIVHGYGVAEVDAACLLAKDRTEHGHLIYVPRNERVEVTFDADGQLLLSLRDAEGGYVQKEFPTGDSGKPHGDGYVIWNHERLHPNVLKILESWKPEDWERRTGYLYYGREVRFQLRKGEEPRAAIECEFHEYEKRYGQYWLFKPQWNRVKDEGRDSPLRRTIL